MGKGTKSQDRTASKGKLATAAKPAIAKAKGGTLASVAAAKKAGSSTGRLKHKTESLIDELDSAMPNLLSSITKANAKRKTGEFGVLSKPRNQAVVRHLEAKQKTEDSLDDAMRLIGEL